MWRNYLNLFLLQKEWLDKCEQAKRAKLAGENSTDKPENDKYPKEDKVTPSRSMSLDSNTLGKIYINIMQVNYDKLIS